MITKGFFFFEEKVATIQKIPVSLCNSPNKLIWRCTTNGLFYVRSAYHLQIEIQRRGKGESSSCFERNERWEKPWNLVVPNAEKPFLWKACNDGLPTKKNLFKKKIVDELNCPIYL